MKVLIVANFNKGKFSPFIIEQVESIQSLGVEFNFYGVQGKGLIGYLLNRKGLIKKIHAYKPDLIHAHYGLSGLLSNLQRKVPVITTFHGSDINAQKILCLSKLGMKLSKYNIFVSKKNIKIAKINSKYSLVPCGVNLNTFYPIDKNAVRKELGFESNVKVVLFAGAFNNEVKNYTLAQQALNLLLAAKLIELKNYDRHQVCLLLNACDVLLITSFTEGSPQVVKEAMACNLPIVSTDVGDVKQNIEGLEGCYICSYHPQDVAEKIKIALEFSETSVKTTGRDRIIALGLDTETTAKRIIDIYSKVIQEHN
jgi:teichuronic acid biosynthesis glycosyltransferase TuaC